MPKSTEAGHHEKRVYISQDGVLVVPSSAKLMVEPGGMLNVKPSTGGINGMVSSGLNISNRGITIITNNALGVDSLAQPTVNQLGTEKTIIWNTTATRKLRLATGAGLRDVRCGTSSCSVIQPTSTLQKMAKKTLPVYGLASVTLVALSTDRWAIKSITPHATGGLYWVFSSCT
jgi:hypothetical protein